MRHGTESLLVKTRRHQARITKIATQPQIALHRTQNDLQSRLIERIRTQSHGCQLGDDKRAQVHVIERQHLLRIANVASLTPDEVYDHPVTPFVYQFLGNVNAFLGRVHRGVAQSGAWARQVADHDEVVDAQGTAFVRPYGIEISASASGTTVPATLNHAVKIGALVCLELIREDTGGWSKPS